MKTLHRPAGVLALIALVVAMMAILLPSTPSQATTTTAEFANIDIVRTATTIASKISLINVPNTTGYSVTWTLYGPASTDTKANSCTNLKTENHVFGTGKINIRSSTGYQTVNTIAKAVNVAGVFPGSCFNYVDTISSSANTANTDVTFGDPRGQIILSSGSPDTVFLDPEQMATWTQDNAVSELSLMKAQGFTRVILQNTAASVSQNGIFTTYTDYTPTSQNYSITQTPAPVFPAGTIQRNTPFTQTNTHSTQPSSTANDDVETLLSAADTVGLKVELGLDSFCSQNANGTCSMIGYNTAATSSAQDQIALADEQVYSELQPKVHNHLSFAGWYIPTEFSSAFYTSVAGRNLISSNDAAVSAVLAANPDAPSATITISPYIDQRWTTTSPSNAQSLYNYSAPNCLYGATDDPNAKTFDPGSTTTLPPVQWNTPCQFAKTLSNILAVSNVNEILLQDGMGTGESAAGYVQKNQDDLRGWINAVSHATATKNLAGNTASYGTVLELFQGANSTAPYNPQSPWLLSPPYIQSSELYESVALSGGSLATFGWNQIDPVKSYNSNGTVNTYNFGYLSAPTALSASSPSTGALTINWAAPTIPATSAPTGYQVSIWDATHGVSYTLPSPTTYYSASTLSASASGLGSTGANTDLITLHAFYTLPAGTPAVQEASSGSISQTVK